MAFASDVYTGNGSQTAFDLTFDYVRPEHVVVFVNFVSVAYTYVDADTVNISPAPGNGLRVEVRRVTPLANPLVDFTDGSILVAADLDTNALQNLYIEQELDDRQKASVFNDDATGLITAGGRRITAVANPTSAQDAATKNYVDTADALKVAKAGDSMTGALAMGTNKITGLGTPTVGTDATTKTYVDTADALKVAKAGDSMTGALAMGTNKITGLGTPTTGTDASTKAYVDATVSAGIPDGDKGDITVSGVGTTFTIDNNAVTSAKILDGTILDADVNATAGIVASKLSFTQAGTGAVARTVESKLQEIEINVKDFGAVGDGVAYDSPAIGLALAQAQQIVNNGANFGSQVGVTLKFPRGKYRISQPIPLLFGIKIVGEQSGLINAGNALSTGTILLLSDTLPNSSSWTTSSLVGQNTIAKRVMFTIIDGGPIQMENFGAIPENNNSTNAVFLLAGNGFAAPYNNVGVTQALFRGIRAFEFGEVFRGSRFFDVTIENCGFEYNTTVFSPVASGFVAFGDINSTNTQYFENYSLVDLLAGASFNNTNFSSCIFATESNTNSNLVWGYGGDFSNVHFSSCEFFRGATNTGNAISVIGDTFICQGVTFASCRIKDLPLFNGTQIASPNDQLLNNSFAGNTFENCPVTIEFEGRGGNSFVGNAFTGTSFFSHKGDGLVFAANNFNENSFSGNDFTLVNTANATVVGNVFRNAKQSINFATLLTCKITDNVNQRSFANLSETTVTGGTGGWSNSSPTPTFYFDETGHVRCRGVVIHSGSPTASSIMCQGLPIPARNASFVLPATDNSAGNAVVIIGNGGSELYYVARNGTSAQYDLSPISYSTL